MSDPNTYPSGDTSDSAQESLLRRVLSSKQTTRIGVAVLAGSMAAGLITMPHHKVDAVVRQDAPALEQMITKDTPVTLESGTKLTAECRHDDGMVIASEQDTAIYTLYEIDPQLLQAAGEPNLPTHEWAGKLAVCGQE